MRYIIRFKSFNQAADYALKEFCERKFDPKKTERFFHEYSRILKNPYKPGIYKFKSFEQARKYDIYQHLEKKRKK